MTNEELKTAEDIAKNATKGPWFSEEAGINGAKGQVFNKRPSTLAFFVDSYNPDAEYIAHFNPTFCLRLIEKIRRLQKIKKDLIEIATDTKVELNSATEVIKFYGDKDNWEGPIGNEHSVCDTLSKDAETATEDGESYGHGGKRAREWLEKRGDKNG